MSCRIKQVPLQCEKEICTAGLTTCSKTVPIWMADISWGSTLCQALWIFWERCQNCYLSFTEEAVEAEWGSHPAPHSEGFCLGRACIGQTSSTCHSFSHSVTSVYGHLWECVCGKGGKFPSWCFQFSGGVKPCSKIWKIIQTLGTQVNAKELGKAPLRRWHLNLVFKMK